MAMLNPPFKGDIVVKGTFSVGSIDDVEKTIKQSNYKLDCLINILIQKGIIGKNDVQEIIDAFELIERLENKV